jgi:hypothetical protein
VSKSDEGGVLSTIWKPALRPPWKHMGVLTTGFGAGGRPLPAGGAGGT